MVPVRKSNGMVKIGLLTECDCLFIQILHFDIPGKGSDDSFYMCINNIHVCWDNVLHHVADVLKMLYRSGKVMKCFYYIGYGQGVLVAMTYCKLLVWSNCFKH